MGELIEPFHSTAGYVGSIVIRTSNGTKLIPPDIPNPANAPTAPPVAQTTLSVPTPTNKVKIAKPPRFTGDRKNWEGFLLATETYLAAYESEFQDDEQRIWFIISYLGTEDGSPCTASDWLRNWKNEHTHSGYLLLGTYNNFLTNLREAFEDPNLKINAANELRHLRQGKDTLLEYFTKFELKAGMAGYRQLDAVLIDLLKTQV